MSRKIKGQRSRCWDFCTNYLYTLEASGHNPRNDINKRYKNKINCKYNYNFKRHDGLLYCVGCGRCVEVCPADMDIRQIVGTILKNSKKS
jgi:sulfhydrogenase subunit beta (sulfur reductase)